MATASINANGTTLCWNNTPGSTAITFNTSVQVTNNAGVTVYWWTGSSQPSGGGTQLAARANHTFSQVTTTVVYNFGNSSTSGSQITLTVTGKGGTDDRPS